jgi:predicted nucleotidyltransferase
MRSEGRIWQLAGAPIYNLGPSWRTACQRRDLKKPRAKPWVTHRYPSSPERAAFRVCMPRIPSQIESLLDDLTRNLRRVLQNNLFGIYLYGSLTQRAFNPACSDIDCLVVTHRVVTTVQFASLKEWLAKAATSNPWVKRLQMTLLLRNELLIRNSPSCLYQFGTLKRTRSDANPIIWLNVLKSGITLFGPKPESFVPEITSDVLLSALRRELGYLREEIIEKANSRWRDVPSYRSYAVLTLCRILYSFRYETIVSKPRAARWALTHLPTEWHEVILLALGSQKAIPLARIRQFIRFADQKSTSKSSRKRRRKLPKKVPN